MTLYVVDASIVVKWFVPELHESEARSLVTRDNSLLAPDLLVAEVANALMWNARRGLIPIQRVAGITRRLPALVRFGALGPLVLPAIEVALAQGITVYDATYVALARRERSQLVTADRRLYNAVSGVLPETMLWVGDVQRTGESG